ncbi:MAG: AAA family ATPase [Candidatus Micrarchaeia archaeon]|jgi:chromosome segregation protein
MVFISKLSMRNFKSFKKADLTLAPGLICLAGPNGSGKSNVTDAIRFALGEMALKQLRPEGKKASGLIHRDSHQAMVSISFGGEGAFEIKRAIRKDGKMAYRLDEKHATRTSVMDALHRHSSEAGEHNIIAQGEVDRVVKMNAKERREIIDRVSGVSDFDEKKKEAISELDKVEGRIGEANIAIGEREGVLEELAKQKEQAMRYASLATELKRAKGTLIHAEMTRLEKEFEQSATKNAEMQRKLEELQSGMEGLDAKIGGLESERAKIAAQINERAGKEGLRDELERLRSDLQSNSALREEKLKQMEALKGRIADVRTELSQTEEKIKLAKSEAASAEKESQKLASELKAAEKEKTKMLAGAGGKKAAELRKRHAELLKQFEDAKRISLDSESAQVRDSELAKLKQDELSRIAQELGTGSEKTSGLEKQLAAMRAQIAGLAGEEDSQFDRIKELNKKVPDYDRKILEIGNRMPEIRVASGTNPAVEAVMQASKGGKLEGIVGTVLESCSFDDKYAVAVESSAGGRLHYVLTEDIDSAVGAVAHLKQAKAGRCSFIPLDRKMSQLPAEAARFEKADGVLGFLIDMVKFDKRMHGAMHYVFGDTLLVRDAAAAKKLSGRVRAVTLDGDLFEVSGIVTGGMFRSRSPLKSRMELEKLEKEMADVQAAKKGATEELYSIRELIDAKRKERANLEVGAKGIEIEINSLSQQNARLKDLVERKAKLADEVDALKSSMSEAAKKVNDSKSSLSRIETELSSISRMLEGQELPEEKQEEIALMDGKLSELSGQKRKFDDTASSKQAELKLFEEQVAKGKQDISDEDEALKLALANVKELEASIASNSTLLTQKEEKLREVSKAMTKLYEQQEKMGPELEAAQKERGRHQANFTRVSNDMSKISAEKQVAETRLADYKAEWENYKDVEPLKLSRDELQDLVRETENQLNSLGAVNMQAPEQYEGKSQELEEKKGMVKKLSEEKKAVLSMIEEIEGKKAGIFMETFRAIDASFRKIFNYAFPGEGALLLDTPEDIFNSGLQIRVKIGGKEHFIEAKSGGERTLLALLFVFAIHSTKPASFYILDEADAALDKENSKKLADLLKQMSRTAQFIVVTHNDTVLSSADIALGVTKQNDSSRIVGIEFKKMQAASA